ncbi:hypothetical protein F2P56_012808 [Juglans regia]|uniref:RNase H type-1 domain-containing protein n=2 Tax=Juglans regia TaxID=51240 RepID=A0A834CRA9_JUGRE|nr:uncharacterized protein LOC109020208 [Juglans regia]KAF5468669.1 hypothetical protein F2P56_012808 [Juglans regia]
MHAVWSYPAASDVWSEGNSPVHKLGVLDFGFEELWGKLNATLKIDEVEMGLAEYKMAQDQLQTNQVRSNADRSVTKWEKPGGSVIKANWDAAVDAKNKCVGIGVVVRDSNGEILACLCSRFAHNSNPYVAEALSLRKAVTFCSEMGFSDVVLGGDSLIIVNATKSGEEIGAEYGCIIDDVRRIMNGRLSWDVRFVYREANNTAHKLARLALTVGDENVWIEDNPVEIASDILVEKLCND